MKNLVISVSGGRSSGMVAHIVQNSPKYKDYNKLFIFANTGKENEGTLEFVHKMDKKWGLNIVWAEAVVALEKGVGIEAYVTDFEHASRNGEPFDAVIEKFNTPEIRGVPTSVAPYCSKALKTIPIDKYAKEYFGSNDYITAIGFRYEDLKNNRISAVGMKHDEHHIYPLLQDFGHYITQKDVLGFWRKQPFDLNIAPEDGNCDFCWQKKYSQKIAVLRKAPKKAEWWADKEARFGGTFDYRQKSVLRLLEEANKPILQTSIFDEQSFNCMCTGV
ncbi:MAG: phosphoadenosine phosphosulfate reductase family protein [Bacteroidales bacterium]